MCCAPTCKHLMRLSFYLNGVGEKKTISTFVCGAKKRIYIYALWGKQDKKSNSRRIDKEKHRKVFFPAKWMTFHSKTLQCFIIICRYKSRRRFRQHVQVLFTFVCIHITNVHRITPLVFVAYSIECNLTVTYWQYFYFEELFRMMSLSIWTKKCIRSNNKHFLFLAGRTYSFWVRRKKKWANASL